MDAGSREGEARITAGVVRSMAETEGPLVDTHAHAYTLDMPLSPTAWHRPQRDGQARQEVAGGVGPQVLGGDDRLGAGQ